MNLEGPEQRYRAKSCFVGNNQYVVGWFPVDTAVEFGLLEVAPVLVVVEGEVAVAISFAVLAVAVGVAVDAISIAVLVGAEVVFVLVDVKASDH